MATIKEQAAWLHQTLNIQAEEFGEFGYDTCDESLQKYILQELIEKNLIKLQDEND